MVRRTGALAKALRGACYFCMRIHLIDGVLHKRFGQIFGRNMFFIPEDPSYGLCVAQLMALCAAQPGSFTRRLLDLRRFLQHPLFMAFVVSHCLGCCIGRCIECRLGRCVGRCIVCCLACCIGHCIECAISNAVSGAILGAVSNVLSITLSGAVSGAVLGTVSGVARCAVSNAFGTLL